MPYVGTQNEVIFEDLARACILADVRNTPFITKVKKGAALENMLFSWTVENMGARRTDTPPENADVAAFESDQQTRLYGRAQEFWRTPRVSKISERINKTPGNFGKYDHQLKKQIDNQKRDIEYRALSTGDSSDDTGTVGSRMMGYGRAVDDGTLGYGDQQTAIPATFRTPTAQIYTGTLANLQENDLINILKSRYDSLGQTMELTLFSGSTLKQHISEFFGKYKPDKTGFTVVVRTQQEALNSQKFAAYGIDLFESDFGPFDIILTPFIGSDGVGGNVNLLYGYGLNMDYVQLRVGMMAEHSKLPYMGGGESGLVDSILGHEAGDYRGHFKIAPSGP